MLRSTAKLMVGNGVARFPGLDERRGFNCAFSTLTAGNMSANWGPRQEAEKNARQFYRRAGFRQDRVHLHPKHEAGIVRVGKEDRGQVVWKDGLVTTVPGLTLSLYSADCLPIVITQASQQPEFVALVHTGWSGTNQRILGKAIRFIKRVLDLGPEQLLVLIGPGIHSCCYRDPNLASFLLEKPSWGPFVQGNSIDLVGYNIQQAMEAGVQRQNLIVANECTGCARSRQGGDYLFFSHHRSGITGEKEGRFATAVALP